MAATPLKAILILIAAVQVRADFEPIEFLSEIATCNATLTTSVPAVCQGKVAQNQKYDVWKTSYDFMFGKISEAQWQALKEQFTAVWAGPKILAGETPLFEAYDASKQYLLKDFLPVSVRALCNHNFVEEQEALPEDQPVPTLPRLYNKSVLVPNCWTTVYETLRSITQTRRDDTTLFYDTYSTDDKDAQRWLKSATRIIPGNYTEAKRQFGDVMFIWLRPAYFQRAVLEHAVLFVDQDIVFEKAGSGNKNPYRLTDVATVEKEWKPTGQGGMFEWELHRPTFGSEQSKSFIQEFSISSQTPDKRWPQFWAWPKQLQERYTLGSADSPVNTTNVDGLTLLEARRYGFEKQSSGQWLPVRQHDVETKDAVCPADCGGKGIPCGCDGVASCHTDCGGTSCLCKPHINEVIV